MAKWIDEADRDSKNYDRKIKDDTDRYDKALEKQGKQYDNDIQNDD